MLPFCYNFAIDDAGIELLWMFKNDEQQTNFEATSLDVFTISSFNYTPD